MSDKHTRLAYLWPFNVDFHIALKGTELYGAASRALRM
jgi:hypothetical protein